MINKIFLSLGSNQGDKIKNLNSAIISIKKFAVINHISNYFLSEAIDVRKQEDFINIALEISTQLSADELLLSIKEIEVSMGRDITKIGEPRVIDIDIIKIDERLSSKSAENLLIEQGFKTGHNKSMIDDTSAAIILQEYIDSK